MGTTCLEAKLATQLAYQMGNPFYHIYIDFAKACNSLDHSHTLILLVDYRVISSF